MLRKLQVAEEGHLSKGGQQERSQGSLRTNVDWVGVP